MRRALLASLAVLAGLSRPVMADDWQDCRQGSPDRAIAACSQIIDKGPESDKQVGVACSFRGTALRKKGENDKAIADYTKAIEVDPKHAAAPSNRGVAYIAKSETEKALADLNKALELD